MGNLCGKQSKTSDPFAQPGRTIGSVPSSSNDARASVPPKISSQGHTLGGPAPATGSSDARQAAAKAAQVNMFPPLFHTFSYAELVGKSQVSILSDKADGLIFIGKSRSRQSIQGKAGERSCKREKADKDRHT